jgi:molybdopterin molybdotransferase
MNVSPIRMRHPGKGAAHDVRMRGFAQRHTVEAALNWLDSQLQPLGAEDVPLRIAAGRVLADSVVSCVDVPGFDRAAMDTRWSQPAQKARLPTAAFR